MSLDEESLRQALSARGFPRKSCDASVPCNLRRGFCEPKKTGTVGVTVRGMVVYRFSTARYIEGVRAGQGSQPSRKSTRRGIAFPPASPARPIVRSIRSLLPRSSCGSSQGCGSLSLSLSRFALIYGISGDEIISARRVAAARGCGAP